MLNPYSQNSQHTPVKMASFRSVFSRPVFFALFSPQASVFNALFIALFIGGSLVALPSRVLAEVGPSTHVTAAATKSYKIKMRVGKNGKVSPSGTRTVSAKSRAEYTITPAKGFFIDTLTVNGATPKGLPKSKGKPYTLKIAKVSENLTIVATFAKQRTIRPLSLGSQMSVVDPK